MYAPLRTRKYLLIFTHIYVHLRIWRIFTYIDVYLRVYLRIFTFIYVQLRISTYIYLYWRILALTVVFTFAYTFAHPVKTREPRKDSSGDSRKHTGLRWQYWKGHEGMRRVAGYVAKWAGMATTWAGMLAKVSQTQPVSGVHAYSVLVGIRLVGLYLVNSNSSKLT